MGTTIRRRNKKGIAIFMVLFIMVVLGALMVQFHQNSRQAQNTVHRFQTSEMARQLAAAGQEEAFDYLHNQTGNIYDASFNLKDIPQKFIEKNSDIDMSSVGSSGRNSVRGLDLPIPVTRALAESLMPGRMEITATARIVDFRNTDYDGNIFYENEGIGTIEIVVTAKAKNEFKHQFPGSCTIVRHHDYKVVTILTKKENRENRYSGSSYLDYALFIRKGQNEFESGVIGTSLNPENVSLEIDAGATPGKVNLGSYGNKYTFLNTSKETEAMIPNAGKVTAINELTADGNVVDKIYPYFRSQVKKQCNDKDANLDSMTGHKAIFEHIQTPPTDEYFTNEDLKNVRIYTVADAVTLGKNVAISGSEVVFHPGIRIKPEEKLSEILETDVRKQFINIGYFKLDLSECKITVSVDGAGSKTLDVKKDAPQLIENFHNAKIDCFDNSYSSRYKSGNQQVDPAALTSYIKSKGEEIASQAFSHLNDEFAYATSNNSPTSNSATFYKPSITETSTAITDPGEAHYPYSYFNLWNKRLMTSEELESLGIYDKTNNELHLRGIVHCQNPITLGDSSSELKVDGCGVIIAPGISIEGAIIKKNPQDVCVLFARDGSIRVKTSKEIQAALIAMGMDNKTSSITAGEQLNLKGSLVTDLLLLSQWKNGVTHKITYDDALAPTKDIYQINISKWVSFERVVENE